jgi:hypothetical protein
MKQFSGSRKTTNLSKPIHKQLNMYAIAAGAAGVSMLALAQPVEAKIVYTPVTKGGINQDYGLDLNHDGVVDFSLQDLGRRIGPGCSQGSSGGFLYRDVLRAIPTGDNGVEGSGLADALTKEMPIGRSQDFAGARMAVDIFGFETRAGNCRRVSDAYGNWVNVADRYLGLKFKIKGETHYGWARLSVHIVKRKKGIHGGIAATLTGYAYETIAGKSIEAGQTKEAADDPTNEDFGPGASLINPIPDTPQPASLGLLAMGAPGLSIWLRKESALQGS